MLYREYTEKIKKYAEIRDRILKYKILIICVLCLILAALTGFLITKGIILEDVHGDENTVYGDVLDFRAKALFTRARLEYTQAGSEDWSEEIPVMPGQYRVRVMAKRSFGGKNYGTPHDFTISKREATVGTVTVIQWMDEPYAVVRGLAEGDNLSRADIRLDSYDVGHTTAYIGENSVRIVNESGDDVTAAYILTLQDTDVSITRRKLTISVNDTEKIYDGTPVSSGGFKVTGGDLVQSHSVHVEYIFDDGVNVGSHSIGLSRVTIYSGSTDVSANYDVSVKEGRAVITPRKVKVIAESASKRYDGTPLTASFGCVPAPDSGINTPFASGESPQFSPFSITDVIRDGSGNVKSAEISTEMRVFSHGIDVTHNYQIQYERGKLTVTPRTVDIKADDYSKKYDGMTIIPVEGQNYHVTNGGLLSGHYISAAIDGDTISATETPRKYTLKVSIFDGGIQQDKTSNYDIKVSYSNGKHGTISISHRIITVSTGSYTWEYDGNAHDLPDIALAGEGLAPNEYWMVNDTTFIKNVGSVANNIKIKIYNKVNGDGDTTDNYKISYVGVGTLRVDPRSITIISSTASKMYDATPLFSTVATAARLVKTHRIEVTKYSSITDVSRDPYGKVCGIANVIVARIFDGKEDVTSNYDISYAYGRLTVEPRVLVISANSADKIYDRTPISDNGYTLGGKGLALPTHTFTESVFSVSGSRTAVGSSPNKLTQTGKCVITDSTGKDVTFNYDISLLDGVLTVLPLNNVFEPNYMGKEYDGVPLSAGGATHVSGHGVLAGDSIIFAVAQGSRTLAGIGESSMAAVVIRDEYGYTVAVNGESGIVIYHVNFKDASRPMYVPVPDSKYTYVCIRPEGGAELVDRPAGALNYTQGYVNRDGETVNDSYYEFEFLMGVINIRQRRVTISTGSATQQYVSGTSLTENSWRITQGSMIFGHYLTAGTTGVAKDKGVPVNNTIDLENIIISDENGNDITKEVRDSYSFSVVEGILLLT